MLSPISTIAGEYHCPVLNKVFTEFTHIVAVRTTGNVFCYEVHCHFDCLLISSLWISFYKITWLLQLYIFVAFVLQAIKELNLKTKNWKELLTDEPFTREDLITIQVLYEFILLIELDDCFIYQYEFCD